MANIIGEYIHLHYENYKKYGLLRGGENANFNKSTDGDLTIELINQKYKIKNMMNIQKNSNLLKEMEEKLNFFFNRNNGDNFNQKLTEDDIKQINSALIEYLNELFGIDDITSIIDFENNTIDKNKLSEKSKIAYEGVITLPTLKRKLKDVQYISTIQKRLSIIQNGINTLKQQQNVSKLQNCLNTLNSEFENIKKEAKNVTGKSFSNEGKEKIKNSNFFQRISELAREVYKGLVANELSGEFGEAIVAAVGIGILSETNKVTADIIKQVSTGSNKGKYSFSSQDFIKGVNLDEVFKGYHKKKNNDITSWETSSIVKGKSDISFTVNDEFFNFSVKNYNLDTENIINNHLLYMGLVSETNLFNLFKDNPRTLNHYLNQTVNSKDRNGNNVGPDFNVVKEANNIMQKLILYKGLSHSAIENSKDANLFVVLDKSTKRVKIFDINNLFQNLISSLDSNQERKFNITGMNSTTQWDNSYNNISEAHRLTKLLAAVHQNKLSASIKKTAIKELM